MMPAALQFSRWVKELYALDGRYPRTSVGKPGILGILDGYFMFATISCQFLNNVRCEDILVYPVPDSIFF